MATNAVAGGSASHRWFVLVNFKNEVELYDKINIELQAIE
jgi:hypothetical protein